MRLVVALLSMLEGGLFGGACICMEALACIPTQCHLASWLWATWRQSAALFGTQVVRHKRRVKARLALELSGGDAPLDPFGAT